jgi:hypothetical protein
VKLDLMRDLLNLNQAFEQVISGLTRMEKAGFFQTDHIRYARAEVESARVDANREFFDNFSAIVERDARWAYKFRSQYDQKTKDPFDFYLELKEREESRKNKGLPPRAALLPGWDKDDEPLPRKRQPKKSRRKNDARRHATPAAQRSTGR